MVELEMSEKSGVLGSLGNRVSRLLGLAPAKQIETPSINTTLEQTVGMISPPNKEDPFGKRREEMIVLKPEEDVLEIKMGRKVMPYTKLETLNSYVDTFTMPGERGKDDPGYRVVLVSREPIEDDSPLLEKYFEADSEKLPVPSFREHEDIIYSEVQNRLLEASATTSRYKTKRIRRLTEKLTETSKALTDSQQELIESREEIEQVRIESLTCALTSLANRRAYEMTALAKIEQVRNRGKKIWMIFIDGNKFGAHNKIYGADLGDRAIQQFAYAVRDATRNGDAGRQDSVYRYGGDEIVVLFEAPEKDAGFAIMKRIKAKLEERSQQNSDLRNAYFDSKAVDGHGRPYFRPEDEYIKIGATMAFGDVTGVKNEEDLGSAVRRLTNIVDTRKTISPSNATHTRTKKYKLEKNIGSEEYF